MPKPVQDWSERLWRYLREVSSISVVTGEASLVSISEDRRRLRTGELYTVTDYRTLAQSGVDNILIRVGATAIVTRFAVRCEREIEVGLFEAPTLGDPVGGTALAKRVRNRNRAAVTEPLLTGEYLDGANITAAGLELVQIYVPAGEKASNVGGADDTDLPIGLKPNTDYLVRVTNLTNETNRFSIVFVSFEDVA